MKHDTPWAQELPSSEQTQEGVKAMVLQAMETQPLKPSGKKRGRPQLLSLEQLAISILWCFLNGWHAQLELWRFLCTEPLAGFAPVVLSDQAIYNRLAKGGAQALQALCAHVTDWIALRLADCEDRSLAPAFAQILALDESKLDPIRRWIAEARGLPKGDPALLAGRMSVLFDVRRQCVRRLDLLPDAMSNSLVHARTMIQGVHRGSLLLFDLGYYSFEWFDELTSQGLWWVSKLRAKGSFVTQHVLLSRDGSMEAIVQLGAYRCDHAAHSVRLISFRYRGVWYRYVTNVLDPSVLSGAQVARLYARRWDVELSFRLLKDHLKLRLLWSAKPEVISVQVWASLILAQLCHSYQVQVASEAGVDVFDVSLDLLIRFVPRLLRAGVDPVHALVEVGATIGIIRPSTRIKRDVPSFDLCAYCWPPSDLPLWREPRYDHRPAGNSNRQKKAAA